MISTAFPRPRLLIAMFALITLLAGCAASSSQPAAPSPPQPLPPPPSAADLSRLSGEIGGWVQPGAPGGGAAPPQPPGQPAPYTLGRPSRIALLDRDTIFQFAPGQSMRAQLRPTGEWFIPVYQQQQLVALAELDATYSIVGVSSLPPQQPPQSVIASYNDPEAEVWYVPFQDYPQMILLIRPSGEQMAVLLDAPNPLYPSLVALGGQEVEPAAMMQTLEDAVTARCRVFWLLWQC
jgi:hypothetical protein